MYTKEEGISVVIPLYNKQDTIDRTINSVLNQSYKKYEIIIIDDGSTDNSYNIAHNYTDNRISIFKQANSGVSVARNNGANKAKYSLLAFLDADDEWDEKYLETIIDMRYNYPDSVFYATASDNHCHIRSLFSSNIPINNEVNITYKNGNSSYFKFTFDSFFTKFNVETFPLQTSAFVCTKSAFLSSGGFNSLQRGYEDWDLCYRLLLEGHLVYCPLSMLKFNKDAQYRLSVMNSKIQLSTEQIGLINIANRVANGECKVSNDVKMFLFNILLTIGANASLSGNFKLISSVISTAKRFPFKNYKYILLKVILMFRLPSQFLFLSLNFKKLIQLMKKIF